MLIKVKVKTGARREEVKIISEDRFEISVKEKPINNEANKRVMELVAQRFGVQLSKVRIIKGARMPSKIISF